jgi:AsmA family protein
MSDEHADVANAEPGSPRPAPKPRRRRALRWLLIGLGSFTALIIACEIAGWPFLAKPVEQALTDTLRREVLLREAEDSTSTQGATVRFFGGLTVKVPLLQIAAPVWSQQPFFLQAQDAEMRLSYGALWRARKGHPLDIELLRANRLAVNAERLKDGRASWQFGDPAAAPAEPDERMAMPTVRELTVRDGRLNYVDAPLRANIQGQVRLSEGSVADNDVSGLVGKAEGTYGGYKVNAELSAAGAMPLLAPGEGAAPTPVQFEIRSNRSAIRFRGTVTDVLQLSGLSGALKVSGPSLGAVGEPLGVTLPTTGPFVIDGKITKQGDLWRFVADQATVGSSRLRAALTYDARRKVPLLAGEVRGPNLMLVDLAPSIGAQPAPRPDAKPSVPGARVLPSREFDLPSLRAMDANVLMSFDRVDLGDLFALPFSPLKTHLTLQGGRLRLSDLEAATAEGTVRGDISLDGTGKIALWKTDLRWSDVRLERWLDQKREGDAPPYLSGRLFGRAQLAGEGRSTAQILGSLDGSVRTSLRGGQISHLAVEAAGIDVAELLGVLIRGDEDLPVQCALVDLKATNGVLKPRAMVVETKDSNVWVDGSLSLRDETMDLRAVVSPNDFSPLTLRTPLRVKGSFSKPDISLEKAPLARKAGLAVLLGLINPAAALLPLLDPGSDDKHAQDCAGLIERLRKAPGAPIGRASDASTDGQRKENAQARAE